MAPVTLVTGGAGFIGSHTLRSLRESGRAVLALDDLSTGHRAALLGEPLVEGSLLDDRFVRSVFESHDVAAVVHFAALCYVGDSTREPGRYYRNNVLGTLNLLNAMAGSGVGRIVFSSSCAVYGAPEVMPIVEGLPLQPINPYGQTKRICEDMLADFHRAHGIDSVSLRYFNAAGADPEGRLGEHHDPETHLIPLVLRTASGMRPKVTVFGDGYATRDGTCIRDYIHVADLAAAHVLALEQLEGGVGGARAFNLGNSVGTTVLEVIRSAERVSGAVVPFEIGPPRVGDPPILVGSSERISAELGWRPRHGDIDSIVATAWRWHRAHPGGYDR